MFYYGECVFVFIWFIVEGIVENVYLIIVVMVVVNEYVFNLNNYCFFEFVNEVEIVCILEEWVWFELDLLC